MPKKSPLVDAYIAKSADFAKPILKRIRKLVHATCPQMEEAIKWSSPFFVHKGVLVAMPAFKQHCALIFWKGKLILGKERAKYRRLTSLADLPADKVLLGYIRKAVELNEAGVKIPRSKSNMSSGSPRPNLQRPAPADWKRWSNYSRAANRFIGNTNNYSPPSMWKYIDCSATFPGPVKRFQKICPALANRPVESFWNIVCICTVRSL
jgi:hypothetical protein